MASCCGWVSAGGGPFVYRPHCLHCHQCVPLRVPVARFVPRRRHRRVLALNAGVVVEVGHRLRDDHFGLYKRYLKVRHPDDGMDPDDRDAFHQFFECAWGDTRFWSFRDGPAGPLLALAAVDHTPNGLSAVYTCFDPALTARSLGTLAILRQIEECARQGIPYLYLGYWVPGSPKMDYKAAFTPAERLTPRGWEELVPPGSAVGVL